MSYPHPRYPTVRFFNRKTSEWSSIKIQRNLTRSWRQDEQSFIRRFPYRLGIAAAQTPPDQARQIELKKEAMRRAARSAPVKIIGSPTLVRVQPIPILQSLLLQS